MARRTPGATTCGGCSAGLGQHPFPARLDFCVHDVGRKIKFARPCHHPINDHDLLKLGQVIKMRERAEKEYRPEINRAFHAIVKAYPKGVIFYDFHIGNVPVHCFVSFFVLIRAG